MQQTSLKPLNLGLTALHNIQIIITGFSVTCAAPQGSKAHIAALTGLAN